MISLEKAVSLMDFVFPNELHVTWKIMIVLYPYITGLVAGAFIISSFYHVFGKKELKPIAAFSLVSSLAFLLFAPLPLLIHLGKPFRAMNILFTPNFSSAMSGFGFVYSFYMLIVILEVWFKYREDIIKKWEDATGLAKKIYFFILLCSPVANEETHKYDKSITKFLAGLGIPVAIILHGYVGFLFGSIKANPWWSTPLLFIIFIFSAIVSGLAVLTFLYLFVHWKRGQAPDQICLNTMASYLWGFMIIAIGLEMMELLSMHYEQTERWEVLRQLIHGKLWYTFIVLQIIICSVFPFILLSVTSLFKIPIKIKNTLIFISSVLLLAQVLLMRWNVVIGGQLVSKSLRGFTSYFPGFWEKEGLIIAVIIFTIPFLLLRQFDKLFPFFGNKPKEEN